MQGFLTVVSVIGMRMCDHSKESCRAGLSCGAVYIRDTKRLVSVNIFSVEGNSAGIFLSKLSPRIFVIKVK